MARACRHVFDGCDIEVLRRKGADPADPEKEVEVTTLRIHNPEQHEVFDFPMRDELKRWLVAELTGVKMATSIREALH